MKTKTKIKREPPDLSKEFLTMCVAKLTLSFLEKRHYNGNDLDDHSAQEIWNFNDFIRESMNVHDYHLQQWSKDMDEIMKQCRNKSKVIHRPSTFGY